MGRHSAKHAKPAPALRVPIRVNWLGLSLAIGVLVLFGSLGVYAAFGGFARPDATSKAAGAPAVSSTLATPAVDTSSTPVEVPSLAGLNLDEAKLVLKAAGLGMVVRREAAGRSKEPTVSSQDPAASALARVGTVVTVVIPKAASAKKSAARPKASNGPYVVCIDPGHQGHSDPKTEPVGPGSSARKSRITGGTTGAFTEVPEYETVLQIATNLKKRLEAAGVTVVMTRTTNDVNISNVERAQLANAAKANLVIRVHADSSTDEGRCGASTIYPAANDWTRPIVPASKRAAGLVQAALVKKTRAVDLGTAERADLAGFNWSTVPTVLVAVGFPSNRVEDRLLVSPNYQDQVAQGLADGILEYLRIPR